MENINFLLVFIEGLLSIFSPCILPVVPIYLSMLSSSSVKDIRNNDFSKGLLITNTIFFTLGISVTFFVLGASVNAMSSFINSNRDLIKIIGGFIIIIMGLFYMDILKFKILNIEKRFNYNYKVMSPVSAFILGFTFSFGWTPCIGPILASVLIISSNSSSILAGNLLIAVYIIGFILPFLVLSIIYSRIYYRFDAIKKYTNFIKKLSGSIIIIAGLIMAINGAIGINKELNQKSVLDSTQDNLESNLYEDLEQSNKSQIRPMDFSLYDQYGNEHTLSDYKGKVVFLNFWATWCPPCKSEMPDIQELYNEYDKNSQDVVILGIASPQTGNEGSKEYIKDFLKEKEYTFPVVFNEKGTIANKYNINAYPSTFIIDKEGYITEYIKGAVNKQSMKNLIENET